MSVIVRDPRTDQIVLYCKGADSAILNQLREERSDVRFGEFVWIRAVASTTRREKKECRRLFTNCYCTMCSEALRDAVALTWN